MTPLAKLNHFCSRLPLHLAVILMCLLWLAPTLGLFVTSFRSREAVRTSGWWAVFLPQPKAAGQVESALGLGEMVSFGPAIRRN